MNSGKTFRPDFDRCPKEVPLLSQVLWAHGNAHRVELSRSPDL